MKDIINFAFVFGCQPADGVKSNTKMMADITELFIKEAISTEDSSVSFPDVLDFIKGQDTNIELSSSATLRPLKLLYSVILITDTLGLVFV